MKFLRNLALGVLLASTQFVNAASCDPCGTTSSCDICDIDFCDMNFSAYIDALYWHVCSGDTEREISPDEGEDFIHQHDNGWDWGFRIGANAQWNCWDFGLRYTQFDSNSKENFYLGTEESDIESEFDFKYKVVDLELGRSCCACDGLTIRPFAGAKLAYIDVDHRNLDDDDVEVDMDYEGYGLYIGLSTRWELCSFCMCDRDIPLALISRFSTGIMDSTFKQSVDGDSDLSVDSIKDCLFVPVHELYLGLEFRLCDIFCGNDGFFQLGYEAQYWGWREYDNSDDITHLGMGGMVMRFGANF